MQVTHPEFGTFDLDEFYSEIGVQAIALIETANRAGHAVVRGTFDYLSFGEFKGAEAAAAFFLKDLVQGGRTKTLMKRWVGFLPPVDETLRGTK
jgi:hypothetical protein